MELVVHESPESVAVTAARRVASLILDRDRERFTLGLAGGTSPEATYRALRYYAADWSSVDFWLSDERWVAPDDERSNGRMASETLIDHVDARFHQPRWADQLDPADSAADYEATLTWLHPDGRPDLVLLGMGDDGHTASLFPGTAALDERERWIVANEVPEQGETRITATYPLLWEAKNILFLVVGDGKAEALRDSFEENTPAGRVGKGKAQVEWHVDTGAASLLS